MKLYEYEAAEIFARIGIPVPSELTASNPGKLSPPPKESVTRS